MKLLSFLPKNIAPLYPLSDLRTTGEVLETLSHLGATHRETQKTIDLTLALPHQPRAIDFFRQYDHYFPLAKKLLESSIASLEPYLVDVHNDIQLVAPLPLPVSLRDAYAFRQHVETSRKNRGLPMIPEFDEFPVFYFSNRLTCRGPGPIQLSNRRFDKLDFELEVATITKTGGIDFDIEKAEECISGFMIFNDLSARAIQMQEMKLSLGPSKGKDFANCFGPNFVTLEELEDRRVRGPRGSRWNLEMVARVNGREMSRGNFSSMHFTFAEILCRISQGCPVTPGEVIGSGTVGTGCFLELNSYPGAQEQWLVPGDKIELEVERLGILHTSIL